MHSNTSSNISSDQQEIDWKSFFLIILDHKIFISLFTLIVTLGIIVISLNTPNQYTASVLLNVAFPICTKPSTETIGASTFLAVFDFVIILYSNVLRFKAIRFV